MPKATVMMQSSSSYNCVSVCNIKIFHLFNSELQQINTKPVIKSKLKDFSGKSENFKVQAALVLQKKNKADHKSMHQIFHLSDELVVND